MNPPARSAVPDSVVVAVLIFLLFTLLFGYWYATLFVQPFEPTLTPPEIVSDILLILFWALLLFMVLWTLLRRVTLAFIRTIREKRWAKILFPVYLAVHLLVYGLVLERIIILSEGAPPFSLGAQAYIEFNYFFTPHTLLNALLQITQNPGIVVIIPPYYGITLGPFALFSALLIGVLVIVHTDRLIRISSRIRRAGGSIIYPVVGVVGGASCCISLPDIAASASPFAAVIFTTPAWTNLLYVLYYLLPLTVIIVFVITLVPLRLRRRDK